MQSLTIETVWAVQGKPRDVKRQIRISNQDDMLDSMATQEDRGWPAFTDSDLIARFAQRDELALGELYDRYSAAANGLALAILGDRAVAQEIVHDSFLKVWANPSLYDPARAAFSTFFLTVVRNAALSRLRSFKYTLSLEDEEGNPLPLADSRVDLLGHSEEAQRAERVQTVLRSLKPVQQETIERAYYQGQSREAIAEAMNVPVGTVKSRLKYAVDRLRELLGQDFEHDTPMPEVAPGEVK